MYTHTKQRKVESNVVEQIMQLSEKEYLALLNQRDPSQSSIYKKRKCFLWKGHYFQLDLFLEPCSEK